MFCAALNEHARCLLKVETCKVNKRKQQNETRKDDSIAVCGRPW